MAALKSAPTPAFDYACLGDAEALAREATGKIKMRCDAEDRAKTAWTRHGLDILRVRRTAKHGHFQGWVKKELPFSVRLAQMMADAAAMLADHLKSENFSSLPVIERAVTYRLAADGTPQAVRDEFLPRLLAGEKGLRKLVEAALKPEIADPAKDDAEEEAAAVVPPVPSKAVADAVDAMTEEAFRAIRDAMLQGRAEELVEAIRWRAAKPVVPHADRIAEKARAALQTLDMFESALPQASVPIETDDAEPDAAQAQSVH